MDELTPLFQEIEFSERWRGYDPDEVDAFVERVARAAARAQGQLSALRERAEQAEARPASTGGAGTTEETLTRTLVLAQKTADEAVAEARAEADRLLADARATAEMTVSEAAAEAVVVRREAHTEAEHLVAEAERRAAELLADADAERRQLVADAEAVAAEAATAERDRLAGEVAELVRHRAFLADDVEILERHLGDERHRLRASLAALTGLLEDPAQFRARPAPATSGVEIDEMSVLAAEPQVAAIDDPDLLEAVTADLAATPSEPDAAADTDAAEIAAADTDAAGIAAADTDIETHLDVHDAVPADEPVGAVAALDDPIDVPVDETPPQPAPVLDEVIERVHAEEPDDALIDLVASESPDPGSPMPPDDELGASTGFGGGDGLFPGFADRAPEWDDRGTTEVIAPPRLITRADLGAEPAAEPVDAGPATAPVPAIDDAELAEDDASLFAAPAPVDDDPFLAQLRDAVAGDEALVGEEEALSAFFDQEEDDGGRSWFGRRR